CVKQWRPRLRRRVELVVACVLLNGLEHRQRHRTKIRRIQEPEVARNQKARTHRLPERLVRRERRSRKRAELAGERGERVESCGSACSRNERCSTGKREEACEVTTRDRAHEASRNDRVMARKIPSEFCLSRTVR